MKTRPDLVKLLTAQDFMEEVLANNHRYKPEPNFSQKGVGTLSSGSTEERVQEQVRNTDLIRRLRKRSKNASGKEPK
jgi:hypothetical protein